MERCYSASNAWNTLTGVVIIKGQKFCGVISIIWNEHKYLSKADYCWIEIVIFVQVNLCYRARKDAQNVHSNFYQLCALFKFKLIQKNNFTGVGPFLFSSFIILIVCIETIICINEFTF